MDEIGALNAVVHLDAEGARKAAAGHDRSGSLAGVPVLVKEIVEVEGLPYRCGSAALDEIGRRDADVVRRLRAAGAIVIGLSHSHEFAYGCAGTSNRVGPCRNPHDPLRMTRRLQFGRRGRGGGRCGAVGDRDGHGGIGADPGGAVRRGRIQAVGTARCRPTVFPLSQTLDHVGVLTRTVADAAYALAALADLRFEARTTPPRLGVVTNPEYLEVTPEVRAAWSAALESVAAAGAVLVDVQLPDWADSFRTAADIQGPEAVANHAGRSTEHYQPDVRLVSAKRRRSPAGMTLPEPGLRRSPRRWPTCSRVSTPSSRRPFSPRHRSSQQRTARTPGSPCSQLLRNTRLANLTRHPAVSLPIQADGLPRVAGHCF